MRMEYPKCPSCGHEIYDRNAKICQFCGAEYGKRPIQTTTVNSRKVIALVVAVLTIVLATGFYVSFSVLSPDPAETHDQGAVASQLLGDEKYCDANMTVIMNKQNEYLSVNRRYADAKEFQRTYPPMEVRCPEYDDLYDVTISGDHISIECPYHSIIVD